MPGYACARPGPAVPGPRPLPSCRPPPRGPAIPVPLLRGGGGRLRRAYCWAGVVGGVSVLLVSSEIQSLTAVNASPMASQ
ncbi:hypothetical protein SUDANB38_02131 [Streptomyces sp. enrichment culture]